MECGGRETRSKHRREQQRRPQRRRIALYSHDTQGLGHIRRNLAIAETLVRSCSDPLEILLISGAPGASSMAAPPGADFLVLPALSKGRDGTYGARSLAGPLESVIRLRTGVLQAALRAFDPDLFIVDKVPRGIDGELSPALADLRRRGRARCVLGLRDVLDDEPAARAQWRADGVTETIVCLYDAVWVYGDPRVYDLIESCALPATVALRTTFTGYLGHGRPAGAGRSADATALGPFVLCLVGGGQDGLDLARCFAQTDFPEGRSGLIVAGPYMPEADRHELERLVAVRSDTVLAGPMDGVGHLLAAAESVVTMGGYNSVCEVLVHRKRALVVPRVRPRTEQLVRAERLSQLGLVDLAHPDHLSPGGLATWLAAPPGDRRAPRGAIDLDGLHRIPALVDGLLSSPIASLPLRSSRRGSVDVAV